MKPCQIPDCDKPLYARLVCAKHYRRLMLYGDPLLTAPRPSLEDRFWAKVSKSDGCWEWTASRDNKGYGKFNAPGFTLAHRFSYVLANGAIFDGFDVDHVCRNRACVKPDHLEAVTHWENLRRAREVRQLKTACKNGHPFTDENTYYPPGGGRQCRACVRAAGQRYRKRAG